MVQSGEELADEPAEAGGSGGIAVGGEPVFVGLLVQVDDTHRDIVMERSLLVGR